jgi:peptidyl-prolyl cis-trans isomerase B (cyclophilin B)
LDLTQKGFYDNIIFHRIIKDFMIQGGDPLSKYDPDGDGYTNMEQWGTGDAGYEIEAEFNTIKHNRGIVSMARSADINSASSQFFIVHQNSNWLDEKYTVFGKLLTEESYKTLDKIANIPVTRNDVPSDLHAAKIIKAIIIQKDDLEAYLLAVGSDQAERIANLPTPEELVRSDESDPTKFSERYVNKEYDFSLLPPKGWAVFYAQPDSGPNDPIVTFLGQKKKLAQGFSEYAPYIYVNVNELGLQTFQEGLDNRVAQYHSMNASGGLEIITETMKNVVTEQGASYAVYFLTAKQLDILPPVPFAQIILSHKNFIYGITYSNHAEYFHTDMIFFDNVVSSFSSAEESELGISGLLEESGVKTNTSSSVEELEAARINAAEEETLAQEGGGCLIATAAFGSEMAPQVQFLREIRDNTVLQTESGTSFMTGFNQFYYSFSPVIADYERENPTFKEAVKLTLTPLLISLTLLQYADIDSESEMLGYGIGVILLNIGVYFVAPAVLIMKVRSLHKLQ